MDTWVLDQGKLLTINTNGGRLFQTERQPDGSHIVRDDPTQPGGFGIGDIRVTDALMIVPARLDIEGGVVPILVIAGIVEGFVSPTPTPAAAKFAIGAAIFVLFALYLSRGWRDT